MPATAFLYGAGLGLGFVTYVPVATFAAVIAAVVLADPAAGAVALGAFGVGRAAALIAATAGLRDWDAAADRYERAGRWLRPRGGGLRIANASAMAALAGRARCDRDAGRSRRGGAARPRLPSCRRSVGGACRRPRVGSR